MKIFAFTDTHGSRKLMQRIRKMGRQADILVCAGDITVFERNLHAVLRRLNSLGKPLMLVPGNHESSARLRQACIPYKNIWYMHRKMKKTHGILFIGHGGGGFSLTNPDFEAFVKEGKSRIAAARRIVLITHQPPYGSRTDIVGRMHTGSKSYRDFIRKRHPLLVICGHLHENFRTHDRMGKSIIVNPGPAGKMLEI